MHASHKPSALTHFTLAPPRQPREYNTTPQKHTTTNKHHSYQKKEQPSTRERRGGKHGASHLIAQDAGRRNVNCAALWRRLDLRVRAGRHRNAETFSSMIQWGGGGGEPGAWSQSVRLRRLCPAQTGRLLYKVWGQGEGAGGGGGPSS